MEELLKLLSDGRSRTIEMLAGELHTTTDDILRKIDFLERSKIIRRVATSYPQNETLLTAGKNPAPDVHTERENHTVIPACQKAALRTWESCGRL